MVRETLNTNTNLYICWYSNVVLVVWIMFIKLAAKKTLKAMSADDWHYEHVGNTGMTTDEIVAAEPDSFEHVKWMLQGIADGYITGEKAHRWLGWAQAVIHIHQEDMPLDVFKEINANDI